MSTNIRADISKSNKYWISKNRYYELKHFCMQYPEWLKTRQDLLYSLLSSPSFSESRSNLIADPCAVSSIRLADISTKISMIENCAKDADKDLSDYILRSVTKGDSYTFLYTKYSIPCSRQYFYNLYRKFFYILSSRRG